jgi:hypothetical protein
MVYMPAVDSQKSPVMGWSGELRKTQKECMVIKKSGITDVVDLGKTQSAAALWPRRGVHGPMA